MAARGHTSRVPSLSPRWQRASGPTFGCGSDPAREPVPCRSTPTRVQSCARRHLHCAMAARRRRARFNTAQAACGLPQAYAVSAAGVDISNRPVPAPALSEAIAYAAEDPSGDRPGPRPTRLVRGPEDNTHLVSLMERQEFWARGRGAHAQAAQPGHRLWTTRGGSLSSGRLRHWC